MNDPGDPRPLVCILDGSVDVTGALVAARREAAILADRARFMLVLPEDSLVRDADLPEFERIERLPIRPLRKSVGDALAYVPGLWAAGRRLARLLEDTGCTRLQVNDFFLIQAWVARRFGFAGRIASWVRIDPRRFGTVGRMWMRAAMASSDQLVAVSSFVAGTLPPGARATIVYDPAPRVDALPPANGSTTFAFIGNFIAGKGQDLAIAAFHQIAERFPRAELRFYGGTMGLAKNAAYRERLERQAGAGAGGRRIHFHPFAEPASALGQALAALNCSASESFSLTCQEASALGRPVIATRSGGPEEIIVGGETGYLIDGGDVEALASRMAQLLDDPGLAARMGQAGASHVRAQFPEDRFRTQVGAIFQLP